MDYIDKISTMRKIAIFIAFVVIASSIQIESFYDSDPQQCIEEKCPTQWAACQKDSKCIPALQDCEKKCGTKESCWTLCLPSKGSQAAIDVAKCAQANKCLGSIPEKKFDAYSILTPEDCIQSKCYNQVISCQTDVKCFPALQDCADKCPESLSCFNTCLAGKNNAAAINLWKCIVDNDCLNQISTEVAVDPTDCIKEKCPNEYAACEKDPKCLPALEACEKKCGTSTSCWTMCLGTKGSQAAINVAKCASANHCMGSSPDVEIAAAVSTAVALADPQQCIEEKCPTQWAACQKDSKCIPALQDCEKKCGTKQSCWTLCLPSKGSQAAIDVAKCAQANNCLGSIPEKKFDAYSILTPEDCI